MPEGLGLNRYSIAQPIAYFLLILGTILLYCISLTIRERPFIWYPLAVAGVSFIIVVGMFLLTPEIIQSLLANFGDFFFQSPYWKTIQEARPWTWEEAWTTFGYSWFLMAGGLLAGVYRLVRDERPEMLYVMVWSALIIYAAFQHIRYEYYIALNIALLAGLCMGEVTDYASRVIPPYLRARHTPEVPAQKEATGKEQARKGQKKPIPQKAVKQEKVRRVPSLVYVSAVSVVVVALLAVLFLSQAVPADVALATANPLRMNEEWREALGWLGNNTADPGVDYYGVYHQDSFQYPPTAYGVMSWWDYGHQITYLAKRIPNANPFQQGIGSETVPGAAPFFITQSEDTAVDIAHTLGTRYVVTDIEMDVLKFWAMATWYNSTAGGTPYQQNYFVPAQSGNNLQAVRLNTDAYYKTMVSRLHNFDGSRAEPGTVFYIEYQDLATAGVSWNEDQTMNGVITNVRKVNASEAPDLVSKYNAAALEGNHATVANQEYDIASPITPVPALRHFRLVH